MIDWLLYLRIRYSICRLGDRAIGKGEWLFSMHCGLLASGNSEARYMICSVHVHEIHIHLSTFKRISVYVGVHAYTAPT